MRRALTELAARPGSGLTVRAAPRLRRLRRLRGIPQQMARAAEREIREAAAPKLLPQARTNRGNLVQGD